MATRTTTLHFFVTCSLILSLGGCEDPAREPLEEEIADLDEHEQHVIIEDYEEEALQAHGDGVNTLAADLPPTAGPVLYSYQQQCTTNGGGTWGPILKFCVTIANNLSTFRIYKKDGSKFTTSGLYSLKQDSMYGQGHGSYSFQAGATSYYINDNFSLWNFPGGSMDYYAFVSSGGGSSWVGPLRIYRHVY